MRNDGGLDAERVPIVERVEARVLMSAGGAAADAKAGIGGGLRGDSYMLVVSDGRRLNTIGGALRGDTLVIHQKTTTVGGDTGPETFQVLRIGANTIGGSVNDQVALVLRGNTIGGVMADDGVVFRGATTIGGTFHPDAYVVRLNTVGGTNQVDWTMRVGANTVGGAFGSEVLTGGE